MKLPMINNGSFLVILCMFQVWPGASWVFRQNCILNRNAYWAAPKQIQMTHTPASGRKVLSAQRQTPRCRLTNRSHHRSDPNHDGHLLTTFENDRSLVQCEHWLWLLFKVNYLMLIGKWSLALVRSDVARGIPFQTGKRYLTNQNYD